VTILKVSQVPLRTVVQLKDYELKPYLSTIYTFIHDIAAYPLEPLVDLGVGAHVGTLGPMEDSPTN